MKYSELPETMQKDIVATMALGNKEYIDAMLRYFELSEEGQKRVGKAILEEAASQKTIKRRKLKA